MAKKELELMEQPEEMIEVKISASSLRDPLSVADLPGVGAATALKLKEAGYETVMAIAVATPGEIVEASGVTELVARKMINAARDSMEMGFQTGDQLLKKRERVIRIKVGAESFNQMLGGGFETGAITECFGEFGSGKTQIGNSLAVNCMKDDPAAVAVYIDTENTFRPDRIQQLAKASDLDPDKVLANIKVAREYNSDHQMLLA
ncbi:MAG TPA: helix-hairpin-helix domain-containing protein, partial [Candidatus Nanoarchaeia archaeon]|nr:helix-hairpin-helix domain-containing protein [Candidatus Nanoarchaeia archaeon]